MTYDLPKEYVDLYNRVAVWVVGDKTVKATYGQSAPKYGAGGGGGASTQQFVGSTSTTVSLPNTISAGYGSITLYPGGVGYGGGGGIYRNSNSSNGWTSSELVWGPSAPALRLDFKGAVSRTRDAVVPIWKEWWQDNARRAVPKPVVNYFERVLVEYEKQRVRGKPSGLIAEALNAPPSHRRSP